MSENGLVTAVIGKASNKERLFPAIATSRIPP